jgi:ribosomal protein S27AE
MYRECAAIRGPSRAARHLRTRIWHGTRSGIDSLRLICPSCGNGSIERTPKRRLPKNRAQTYRQVTLKCGKCGRQAVYIPPQVTQPSERELIGS